MVSSYFEKALKKLNDMLDYNKDDPLHVVRRITRDPAECKLVKILLITTLTFNVSLFLIEIIYFCVDFDVKQFIQFFSLNVGALHSYLTMWITIRYLNESVNVIDFQDSHFTQLSTTKKSTYERIVKHVIIRRYLFLVNCFALNALFIFFLPIFGYEDEYYFAIFFFNEYVKPMFGKYVVYLLRLCFYLGLYPAFASSAIPVQMVLYLLSRMEFELIVLEDNLRRIDDRTLNDKAVEENLIDCIKQYLTVKESMNSFKEFVFWPMLITVAGSFILLLSYVYFIFAQASIEAFPRVFFLGVVGICNVAIYAVCGQGLVDQCENVNRSLYFLRWHGYNKRNCKLLQIFMVATKKTLYLNLIGYVALDATLIMKVYKFVFSSLATIQQVVAVRKKEE